MNEEINTYFDTCFPETNKNKYLFTLSDCMKFTRHMMDIIDDSIELEYSTDVLNFSSKLEIENYTYYFNGILVQICISEYLNFILIKSLDKEGNTNVLIVGEMNKIRFIRSSFGCIEDNENISDEHNFFDIENLREASCSEIISFVRDTFFDIDDMKSVSESEFSDSSSENQFNLSSDEIEQEDDEQQIKDLNQIMNSMFPKDLIENISEIKTFD